MQRNGLLTLFPLPALQLTSVNESISPENSPHAMTAIKSPAIFRSTFLRENDPSETICPISGM